MACTNCENSHGAFTYPPLLDGLQFNIADTIRAEWETDYEDNLPCSLELWYWTEEGEPWRLSNYNVTTNCSGSEDVPLNVVNNDFYLGQLNLNHTFPNGSRNIVLTGLLNVNADPPQNGRLWQDGTDDGEDESGNGSGSSSITAIPTTGTPPVATDIISATAPASSLAEEGLSSDSGSSSNGLSGGAIAGIVIGVLAAVALLVGILWFIWKRPRRNQGEVKPQQGGAPQHPGPYPMHYQHEKPLPPQQLPAQGGYGDAPGHFVAEMAHRDGHGEELGGGNFANRRPVELAT